MLVRGTLKSKVRPKVRKSAEKVHERDQKCTLKCLGLARTYPPLGSQKFQDQPTSEKVPQFLRVRILVEKSQKKN